MNSITSKLLKNIDQLKLERYPLPAHYAMKADSHAREIYAVFLAGVLLSGEHISDNQTRLFQMLLTSLSLENSQASLYERAKETDQDLLREFFRTIDEHDLAQSFIVDAAVLCRIEHTLTEQQVILLSEIADSLEINMHWMNLLMGLVAIILGISTEIEIPMNFEYDKFAAWDEFTYRQFNSTVTNLSSGRWLITENIKINGSLSFDSVILRFKNNASLTFNSGNVFFNNSKLIDPFIKFNVVKRLRINECTVLGEYMSAKPTNAIEVLDCENVVFSSTSFTTKYVRALLVVNSSLTLDGCEFLDCGNSNINGGAINFVDKHTLMSFFVSKTRFINCIGRIGGAIRLNALKPDSIIKCKFEDCRAAEYEKYKEENSSLFHFGGAAVFSDLAMADCNNQKSYCINESSFVNSSVRIGDCYDGSDAVFVADCDFDNSLVVYHNLYEHNTLIENSSGGVSAGRYKDMERDFNVDFEKWFEEY